MTSWKTILASLLLVLCGKAAGEQIQIASGELDNLGIRFASPTIATELAGFDATARVVVPPGNEAVVGVPHAGLLTSLRVAIGDDVVEGDILAELRSPGFIELQREFLDALNTHLLVRNEFERDRQLHAEGIISARRLQETTTRSRIAETGLNEHRQLLGIAGLSAREIEDLESSGLLLDSLEIRAPFNGVVVERMATTGQRLDAMAPVYRLADLSTLWLEINVPQERASLVRPGTRVALDGSVEGYVATVTAIGKAIDSATQFVTVRAPLDGGAASLSPGQFVAVRLIGDTDEARVETVWMTEASAVIRSGDKHYVFARTDSGVDVVPVDVISSGADATYFGARLNSGDEIAISGISALKALWLAREDSGS